MKLYLHIEFLSQLLLGFFNHTELLKEYLEVKIFEFWKFNFFIWIENKISNTFSLIKHEKAFLMFQNIK